MGSPTHAHGNDAITTSGGTITANGDTVAGETWASAVNGFTVTCTAATTVTNTTAGVSFTIGSGPAFPVVVDILNMTVTDNAGANRAANLTHTGSRLWMVLLPGTNVITNTGGTSTVAWNDAYLDVEDGLSEETYSRRGALLPKVGVRGDDECWPWLAAVVDNGTALYGIFGIGPGELEATGERTCLRTGGFRRFTVAGLSRMDCMAAIIHLL